jgi:L-amino acid N-acyltransferase YncA
VTLAVRDAEAGDLPAVLAIHNHVVATTDAIFTEELDTLEGRSEWFSARRAAGLPVLVAERDGEVAGYASYGPFRPWPGYRDTVEHSVHVGVDHRRAGVGRALLEALVERARSAGLHVMVAGIDAANEPSLALHSALGFERCGYMAEVARKQDRMLDLVLMQLTL